jgi:hypothetical protein
VVFKGEAAVRYAGELVRLGRNCASQGHRFHSEPVDKGRNFLTVNAFKPQKTGR